MTVERWALRCIFTSKVLRHALRHKGASRVSVSEVSCMLLLIWCIARRHSSSKLITSLCVCDAGGDADGWMIVVMYAQRVRRLRVRAVVDLHPVVVCYLRHHKRWCGDEGAERMLLVEPFA